jgi:hypothetical protein
VQVLEPAQDLLCVEANQGLFEEAIRPEQRLDRPPRHVLQKDIQVPLLLQKRGSRGLAGSNTALRIQPTTAGESRRRIGWVFNSQAMEGDAGLDP